MALISWRTRGVAVAVSARQTACGKRWRTSTSLAVFGPEIVAPFRDAVRFVDGQAVQREAVQQAEQCAG